MKVLITIAILIALSGCSEESLQRKECENVTEALIAFGSWRSMPDSDTSGLKDLLETSMTEKRNALSYHEAALYWATDYSMDNKYLHCLNINKIRNAT